MSLLALIRPARPPAPLGLLAVVVVGGGLAAALRYGGPGGATPGDVAGEPADGEAGRHVEAGTNAFASVVAAADVCADAAYLCHGLEERGSPRVMRWDAATPSIRVLVPLPTHVSADLARSLQRAAARGIRAWDGHPFPILVLLRERSPPPADVTVRWARQLDSAQLGFTATRWMRRDGAATLKVDDFALSTRSPFNGGGVLSERQVELTAAHEMGHALGLPHSGDEHDVMYPTNTASALSARDYRAMEVLYSLANGAEIR